MTILSLFQNISVHRSFQLWVSFLPSSGQSPLNAQNEGELGQSPGDFMPLHVCDEVRRRPNLYESGLMDSSRGTHVVMGQLHLLQSYWGGGWRGRSEGCCLLWLWQGRRPASKDSCCGEERRHSYEWVRHRNHLTVILCGGQPGGLAFIQFVWLNRTGGFKRKLVRKLFASADLWPAEENQALIPSWL